MGARDAAHADMFTAASASHIRVSVKDDTLGLGARPRRDVLDEPTGLDAFKGLLGRLNGKSDVELEKEQRKSDDIKLARYAASKWQSVRFISGGLLTQEKEDPLPKASENDGQKSKRLDKSTGVKSHDTSNGRAAVDDPNSSDTQAAAAPSNASQKKSSCSKRTDKDNKSERKREKKAKKRKHSDESDKTDSKAQAGNAAGVEVEEQKAIPAMDASISKERRPVGRNAIRGRHIAQKKKALLDDKSLNEVRIEIFACQLKLIPD